MSNKKVLAEETRAVHRCWRKDAKWVAGLLFVATFFFASALAPIVWLTNREQGVEILGTAMAASLSRNGLDDAKDIAEMRAMMKRAKKDEIQPVPGLNITVRVADLEGAPPRELRIRFFKKIAAIIYDGGPEAFANLATDPEMRKSVLESTGTLSVVTAKTHAMLSRAFLILSLIDAAFGLALVLFSSRWGRIGSVGFAGAFALAPSAALWFFLRAGTSHPPTVMKPDAGTMDVASYILGNALQEPAAVIAGYFQTAMLIAVGMMVVALVGSILQRCVVAFVNKQRHRKGM